MAYKDNEGRYERANPYFLDIFQLRLADLQGKTDNECLNEHVVELFGRLEQRVAASGDIAHLDVQLSADAQQSFQAALLPLREDSTHSISSCLVLIPNDSTGHRAADSNTISDTLAKEIKKKNLDR